VSLATLAASVTELFTLNEASGSRVGSVAGLSLTDNNTVASGAGLFGNAGSYTEANSERLSVADSATVSMGDILCFFWCWFNPSVTNSAYLITKEGAGGAEYYLWQRNTSKVRFGVSGTASWGTETTVESSATIATSSWNLAVGWHNPTTNLIGVSCNGEAAITAAHSAGIWDSNAPFELGGNATWADYYSGLTDETGFGKGAVISDAEISELWNGGAGVSFANWAAAAASRPVFRHRMTRFFTGAR
jgi:hypothetical protein